MESTQTGELPLVRGICADTNRLDECVASRSIVAQGIKVGIRTNKPEILERVFEVIPNIWKVSRSARVDRAFSLLVAAGTRRDRSSQYQLRDDDRIVKRSTSLDSILEHLERELKMYLAEEARGRIYVHAGSVGWRGKSIIIPGRSFSGKSSLVAELVRAGATYYSDEYAVLDEKGRVHPYPSPLAIREPGSLKQEKYQAEEFGGSNGAKPLPVGLVVISQYRRGGRWRPCSLSPGEVMLELLANTIPARKKPELAMTALRQVALEARVLKGVRGEAAETARLILEI